MSVTPAVLMKRSRALTLLVGLALAGCAGKAPPVEPGQAQGTPPDLRGSRVMVLPFQQPGGVSGDTDAELAFALRERGTGVTWILPPRLEEVLQRSPGLNARIRGLPVGMFGSAEVRRIGDPLYGDLRRLGALVDAEVALLPVRAWVHPGEDGERVRLSAALIHIRTGRVMWFGVSDGVVGDPSEPAALPSAVDSLARTLLWYASVTDAATTGG